MNKPARSPWNDDVTDKTGWYDADEMDAFISNRIERIEDAVVELHAILHDHLLDNTWSKMWDRIGEITEEIANERDLAHAASVAGDGEKK